MDRSDLQRLSKEQSIALALSLQQPEKTSRASLKPPSTDKREKRALTLQEEAGEGGAVAARIKAASPGGAGNDLVAAGEMVEGRRPRILTVPTPFHRALRQDDLKSLSLALLQPHHHRVR